MPFLCFIIVGWFFCFFFFCLTCQLRFMNDCKAEILYNAGFILSNNTVFC